MLKLNVSPIVETRLREGGWTPDRQVDITGAVERIRKKGFTVLPLAEEILRQFLGLKWYFIPDAWLIDSLVFDMKSALAFLRDQDVLYIEKLQDSKVTPVAWGGGAWVFLMDSDEVMILHDQWIGYKLCLDFSGFLESVFNPAAEDTWSDWDLTAEQIPPDLDWHGG